MVLAFSIVAAVFFVFVRFRRDLAPVCTPFSSIFFAQSDLPAECGHTGSPLQWPFRPQARYVELVFAVFKVFSSLTDIQL